MLVAECLAALGELLSAFFQLLEAYDLRLVGVDQAVVLPGEPLQAGLQSLCFGTLLLRSLRGEAGIVLELLREPLGVRHELFYVIPDSRVQLLDLG